MTRTWNDDRPITPLSKRPTNQLVVLLTAVTCFALGVLLAYNPQPDRPKVGGTEVPALDCEEDEVIAFTGPDTLDCVHFEQVG